MAMSRDRWLVAAVVLLITTALVLVLLAFTETCGCRVPTEPTEPAPIGPV